MSARPWHLLHVFPSFDPGGMEVRSCRVMDLLPPPHRHTLIAMDGNTGAAQRLRAAAVELAAPPPCAGFWRTGRAMAARIRALAPDLVLTYNWGAIETVLGCRLARHRALIHHEEGFGRDEAGGPKRRRTWMRRLLLPRTARAVVVPSTGLREMASRTWWVPRARVHYLLNGVDLAVFHPRPREERDGPLVVGSVARLRPEKDLGTLVEAFSRCQHRDRAKLVLVGEGSERGALLRRAEACGVADRVELAGHLPDPAAAYRGLDVFAMSSRTEQMPLVVLEAMATGLPVVATDVGDTAQMVAPDNAELLVPAGDVAGLAAALDRVLASAELREALGAANRAVCEQRYAEGPCLQAHLDLYDRVIRESRAGG